MNKQNIMVHCSCQFTQLGLEHAICSYPELMLRANLVYYPTSGFFPPNYSVPDVLVLALGRNIGETFTLLNKIMTTPLQQSAKTVLISPRGSPGWLKFTLLGRMNVQAELDAAAPVSMLQSSLTDILDRPQTSVHHWDAVLLSQRELDVIKRLLNGRQPVQIARELGLSSKTVSAHKHNALLKLGVRSLHGLLACNVYGQFTQE